MQGNSTRILRTASRIYEDIFALIIFVRRLNQTKVVRAEEALDGSPIAQSPRRGVRD